MSAVAPSDTDPGALRRVRRLTRHVVGTGAGAGAGAGSGEASTVAPDGAGEVARESTGVVSDMLAVAFKDVVNTTQHGGTLVARVLKAHGVKWVFTLSGGHISPILVGSKEAGIRIIDVRHEVNAVFAADAVARLSGVPGVAAVTAGPGVTNTITAIKNAQMAQSPLVLIGGAAATILKDIDQLSVLKPIVKFAATCNSVRDIVPTLRRAFCEAQSGVPGPVFVEFPLDVLYPISEIRASMGLSDRKRQRDIVPADLPRVMIPVEASKKGMDAAAYVASLPKNDPVFLSKSASGGSWVVDKFLQYKLANLFAGAFDTVDYAPLPVSIPMPVRSDVEKAASMILRAKTPLLLLGSQSTLCTDAADRLQSAVIAMGVPTFLGGMSRGLLGRNSKYHIRQNRRQALKKADVVVLAGAICDFRLDYGRSLSSKSKIISVNRSMKDLTLNAEAFWKPALPCQCDPGQFLLSLAAIVTAKGGKQWEEWAAKLKEGEVVKEANNRKLAASPAIGRDGTPLVNPLALLSTLEERMGDNSILVADGGDFVATASYIVRPRGPLRWLDPGAFGTLGVGGGFALGAKLCRPDAEVWLIWGDGSCGYSVAEYDTFKRHNVPICALVGNDAGWTQIEREQVNMFHDDVACRLAYLKYEDIAIGYGGKGLSIGPGDDAGAIIDEARRLQASGEAVLVNAYIGKTSFREGSLSV